jgi:hypothetical protein
MKKRKEGLIFMSLLNAKYRDAVSKDKKFDLDEAKTPYAYSTGLDLLDYMNGKYINVKEDKGYYSLGIDEGTYIMLLGKSGTSKAQPLDADIITPTGIVKMRDLKVGDLVSTPDGYSAKVTGIFPQGKKKIYRVKFSDGTYIDCADEHLHTVYSMGKRAITGRAYKKVKTLTTTELLDTYKNSDYYIPMTKPVEFNINNDLPLEPDHLGCIINGINNKSFNPQVCPLIMTNDDEDNKLKNLNLWDVSYEDIFIPEIYKFTSVDNRITLLTELVNFNAINESNAVFTTASDRLAEDFTFLIQSLGGIVSTEKIEVPKRFNITFRLPLLAASHIHPDIFSDNYNGITSISDAHRKIVDVEVLDKEVEMQCIYIDSHDHLYLTNDFIVTHNTTFALQLASSIIKGYDEGMIYLDDIEGATDSVRIHNITGLSYDEIKEKVIHRQVGISCESFFKNISIIAKQKEELAKEYPDEFLVHTGRKDSNGNEIVNMPPTVYILDSLALLVPDNLTEEEELSGQMSTTSTAKMNAKIFRQIIPKLKKTNIILIAINHLTTKVEINPMVHTKAAINYLKPDESTVG